MFHEPSPKAHRNPSPSYNNWILFSAISIVIAIVVAIELHIRGLISRAALPR